MLSLHVALQQQFAADTEIQTLLAEIRGADPADVALLGRYSPAAVAALRARTFDRTRLATRRLPYERLDQLVVELLMGVRS